MNRRFFVLILILTVIAVLMPVSSVLGYTDNPDVPRMNRSIPSLVMDGVCFVFGFSWEEVKSFIKDELLSEPAEKMLYIYYDDKNPGGEGFKKVIEDNREFFCKEFQALLKNFEKPDFLRGLAVRGLGDFGEGEAGIIKFLVKQFPSENNEEVKVEIIRSLHKLDPPPEVFLPTLIKALKTGGSALKLECAKVLEGMGVEGVSALPWLLLCEKDADEEVRTRVVKAIKSVSSSNQRNVEVMVKTLGEERNYPVRLAVVRFLGQDNFYSAKAIPALLKSLKDPNPELKNRILDTLGLIGYDDPAVVDVLLKSLENGETRFFALKALSNLDAIPVGGEYYLFPIMKDPDERNREYCANILGKEYWGEEQIRLLAEVLEDKSDWVRLASAKALFNLGKDARPALKILVSRLKDPHLETRQWVILTIGRIGDESAVSSLTPLLKDPDFVSFGVRALGDIGKPALSSAPLIKKRIKEGRAGVWDYYALYRMEGDSLYRKLLVELVEKTEDDSVRDEGVQALGELGKEGEPGISLLVRLLKDRNYLYRSNSALSLSKIGKTSPEVLSALTGGLDEEDLALRSACLSALGELGRGARSSLPRIKLEMERSRGGYYTLCKRVFTNIQKD